MGIWKGSAQKGDLYNFQLYEGVGISKVEVQVHVYN